jgi:PTH1 family peptidyl-tRNA hydrolase
MALFQRVPERKEYALPYTLSYGQSEFMLIIGLGNPGAKYAGTRHNIGFMVIDELAKQLEFDDFKENKDFKALTTLKTVGPHKVILAKPSTFMNNSGQSAQAIASFYKIPLSKIVTLHDELSINFGQIRARVGGQAAGHNGIKSLISHLGAEFGRIRVGIKNSQTPSGEASDFVLAKFNAEEKKVLPELIKESAIMTSEFIYSGDLPHDTRSIII